MSVQTCYQCGLKGIDGKISKCSKCLLAYYCSRDCQVKHWKKHKSLCEAYFSATVSENELNEGNEDNMSGSLGINFNAISTWALQAHKKYKMQNSIAMCVAYQSFSQGQVFRDTMQKNISIINDKLLVSNNNRKELFGTIVNKLSHLLQIFFVHAYRTRSIKNIKDTVGDILLIESHDVSIETLLCEDNRKHAENPIAIHYFSRKEFIYYLKNFAIYSGNILESILESLNLDAFGSINAIPVIVSLKHNQGNNGKSSQCIAHTSFLLPKPTNEDLYFDLFSVLLQQAGPGLHSAQILEVDLISGEVIGFDFNQSHFDKRIYEDGDEQSKAFIDKKMSELNTSIKPSTAISKTNNTITKNQKQQHDVLNYCRDSNIYHNKTKTGPSSKSSSNMPAGFISVTSELGQKFLKSDKLLPMLISFSVDKYQSYGKGALFIFTKSCRLDIFTVKETLPSIKLADRQLLLYYSIFKPTKIDKKKMAKLAKVSPLPLYIDDMPKELLDSISNPNLNIIIDTMMGENFEKLPIVLVTDPTGSLIPKPFAHVVRNPVTNSYYDTDIAATLISSTTFIDIATQIKELDPDPNSIVRKVSLNELIEINLDRS